MEKCRSHFRLRVGFQEPQEDPGRADAGSGEGHALCPAFRGRVPCFGLSNSKWQEYPYDREAEFEAAREAGSESMLRVPAADQPNPANLVSYCFVNRAGNKSQDCSSSFASCKHLRPAPISIARCRRSWQNASSGPRRPPLVDVNSHRSLQWILLGLGKSG